MFMLLFMLLITPQENRTMPTFFRHKRSAGSSTPHVQGGHHSGAANQLTFQEKTAQSQSISKISPTKKSDRKADWRKTSKKITNATRDEPLNGD